MKNMKVSDLTVIYGLDVSRIKSIYKRHIIITTVFALIDLVLMAVLIYFMFKENADVKSYTVVVLGVSIVFMFLYAYVSRPHEYAVGKLYNSLKNCDLIEKSFDIDNDRLYSLVYCMGFKRIKPNKDIDYYEAAILDYCYNDVGNAKKFYKYLTKYINNDEGDLVIYVAEKGNKSYFIDFKENISSSRKDVSYGDD